MGISAKVLTAADVRRVLDHVARQRNANRNRIIILLSFKAGLRACEIAGLSWPMILRPGGTLNDQITMDAAIAKNGSGRRLPLHPELRAALSHLHREQGKPTTGPVVRSERGGHMTPRSIVNWFAAIYAELELAGCSSHSGRRTFITATARRARTGWASRPHNHGALHRRRP